MTSKDAEPRPPAPDTAVAGAPTELAEKRRLARELLRRRRTAGDGGPPPDYQTSTYDMFMYSRGSRPVEMQRFSEWVDAAMDAGVYAFESERLSAQTTEVDLRRENGEALHLLNFSSYNYLGLGYHPAVIRAAQDAVATYGLGANSSPVISGTYRIHNQLQRGLLDFFAVPERGVSLFSSGYAVNLGVLQAFANPGSLIVLDRSAHMSLLEGAKLSGAEIAYFLHNDPDSLDEVLREKGQTDRRVLVCAEGIYSGDGDYGKLGRIVEVCRRHGAFVLVDEAHSAFVAGPRGRGAAEACGVLEEVDFLVLTFSKALSGVGGAVLARPELTRYINWYARCRFFSCALDPAVTGGMVEALELVAGDEGRIRRARLADNAATLAALLQGSVDLGRSESWIVTPVYGNDRQTLDVNNYLQHQGLDASPMQFPAVPKNEARIRLFVTSEHTRPQLERAARILIDAARNFGFQKD